MIISNLSLDRISFTMNDRLGSHNTIRHRVCFHHFKFDSTHSSANDEHIVFMNRTISLQEIRFQIYIKQVSKNTRISVIVRVYIKKNNFKYVKQSLYTQLSLQLNHQWARRVCAFHIWRRDTAQRRLHRWVLRVNCFGLLCSFEFFHLGKCHRITQCTLFLCAVFL